MAAVVPLRETIFSRVSIDKNEKTKSIIFLNFAPLFLKYL